MYNYSWIRRARFASLPLKVSRGSAASRAWRQQRICGNHRQDARVTSPPAEQKITRTLLEFGLKEFFESCYQCWFSLYIYKVSLKAVWQLNLHEAARAGGRTGMNLFYPAEALAMLRVHEALHRATLQWSSSQDSWCFTLLCMKWLLSITKLFMKYVYFHRTQVMSRLNNTICCDSSDSL